MEPLLIVLPGVLWKCYLEPHNLQRHLPRSIWQCNHQPEPLLPCLWPHTSPFWFCLLFSSSCSLYPIPCAQLLPETAFTDYKRRYTEKEARRKKQSKANKQKLRGSSWITLDYAVLWISWPRLQDRFSLEIWGSLYLFSARLVCMIEPKTRPLSQALGRVFKKKCTTDTSPSHFSVGKMPVWTQLLLLKLRGLCSAKRLMSLAPVLLMLLSVEFRVYVNKRGY